MLLLFIICTVVNVILSTIKTIVTVKGGKFVSALMNAATYGFYTYVIVLTATDGLDTIYKAIITASANFVGVYIVKLVEQKMRKDRLWKIEVTIPTKESETVHTLLKTVPHSFIVLTPKHTLFNFYCSTKEESQMVKDIVKQHDAKYFAAETKLI